MTVYYEGYSTTPGSNTSASPDGAPEGMAPSGLNDAVRQVMAAIAQMRDQFAQESRNYFVDPCCRVAQGDGTTTLTTSYKYGLVDLVQCKGSGTAVSAGTITQNAVRGAGGVTSYSCHLSGVTITGTGKVFFRRWIESRDASALFSQAVIFSVRGYQTTGSTINCTITINTANSRDDFSSVTNIGTSGTLTLADSTSTTLSYAVSNMGSCSNGVEMIVEMDCGAVTTKNFHTTDWQARLGTAVRDCVIPPFATDYHDAMRYFETSYDYGTAPGTATTSGCSTINLGALVGTGSTFGSNTPFKVKKISDPSGSLTTFYSVNSGTSGKAYNVTTSTDISVGQTSTGMSGLELKNNTGGNVADGTIIRFHWVADVRL